MGDGLLTSGEFYSALCALLFAIAVIYFRRAGEVVTPVALNFCKGVVGLLLFFVSLAIAGVAWFPAERGAADWLTLLASGVLGIGVSDTLFLAALNRLGAGRTAIVDCLYSPMVVLCAFFYLGEAIRPALVGGMALMAGAILVGAWSPERDEKDRSPRELRVGLALGVLSMAGMAVGVVIAKPVLNVADPWWATTVRVFGATSFLACYAFVPRHRAAIARCFRPGPHWRVVLPGVVIGGYAAMFFWIAGMKYTRTNVASVLNQLAVVFLLIFATLFLKEKLTARKTVAVVMGFAGGVVVTSWG